MLSGRITTTTSSLPDVASAAQTQEPESDSLANAKVSALRLKPITTLNVKPME
jgi:hypothetical protein